MRNLEEIDIQDTDGRIVVSPGLKVRHKDSQYEYTVDSVTQDEKGKHVVVLNLPEEPRFDSDQYSHNSDVLSDLSKKEVMYEVDPTLMVYEPDTQEEETPGVDFIAVPEEEFEKDYEVK